MTDRQKNQVIAINRKIRAYRKALDEAVSSGAKSATISAGGNSQSYSRFDLKDIQAMIDRLETQKAVILRGGSNRRIAPDFC